MKDLEFCIPILGVRDVENDSGSFLDTFASYWDCYFSLNRARIGFSVFNFFDKNSNFVFLFWRSLEVPWTRVCMSISIGTD